MTIIRLWGAIDALSKPDALTKKTAKLQVPADDMHGHPWIVEGLPDGSIRFRRETHVSTYLVTVLVKQKRIKRK